MIKSLDDYVMVCVKMLPFLAMGSVWRLRSSAIWTVLGSAVTQPNPQVFSVVFYPFVMFDVQCILVMENAYPPPRAAMVSAQTLSTTGSVPESKNVLNTQEYVQGLRGCVLLTRETPGVCVRTLPGEELGVVLLR